MKHKFLIFLLIFSLSCGNDDTDSGNTGGGDNSFFQCKIDGEAYKITDQNAFAQKIAEDLFAIYGNEDPTKQGARRVYISLVKVPTVGKYEINNNDVGSGSLLEASTGTLFNSAFPNGSGELEITEISANRVKGKFSYIATKTDGVKKDITEGSFDVKIK